MIFNLINTKNYKSQPLLVLLMDLRSIKIERELSNKIGSEQTNNNQYNF